MSVVAAISHFEKMGIFSVCEVCTASVTVEQRVIISRTGIRGRAARCATWQLFKAPPSVWVAAATKQQKHGTAWYSTAQHRAVT